MLSEVLLVLGRNGATLGSLLDGEADAPPLKVQVDDLHPQLLSRGNNLLWQLDMVGRHLRDVNETLDSLTDLDEGSERDKLRDPAVDELADLMCRGELLPRILLSRLERKAYPLAAHVDLQHLHVDLLADGHDRTGMVDMLP